MADVVKVVEPVTGTVVSVSADSVQAKQWKRADAPKRPARKQTAKAEPAGD